METKKIVKEVVIAAFEKDYTAFVDKINSDVKVTIYRKGPLENIKHNEIYLSQNVGRCEHTFYTHIVNNYNFLPDYLFTSQDYPYDHVSNYYDIINGDKNTWDLYSRQTLDDCWFFLDDYRFATRQYIIPCNIYGGPEHPVPLDIQSVWNELFVDEIPDVLYFVPGGHFCVGKKTILSRPLYFYEKVLKILETNAESPYVFERLANYMFNKNYTIRL